MASRDPSRPNIIFALSDDQGAWAMGCAGNREIVTPTLDALARAGTRLENFFCASPVCSPARASLLTGQVPSGHGVHDYLYGEHVGPGAVDFLAGQHTYLDAFAAAGYRLGLSGKWHLGANDRPRPGFVHWYAHAGGGGSYTAAPMFRDGQAAPADGYLTDLLADDAIAFVATEQDRDEPFFLSLNFTAPHSPWKGEHPTEVEDLYRDCAFTSCPQEEMHPWLTLAQGTPLGGEADPRAALVGYFAAVTAMDRALGRVIRAVRDLGLETSTLVVFSSDNGFNAGHHGIWGKGNGTYPVNMYDTSIRVPAIFTQPGRVEAGRVCEQMLSAYDVGATLLELAGLDPTPLEDGPGRSFADLLTAGHPAEPPGRAEPEPRERVVVFDEYGPTRMIRTPRWKYVDRHPDGPDELYDLVDDPDERRNLVADPRCDEVRERARAELLQWFDRYADTARDGRELPVIGTGQAHPLGSDAAFRGPLWERVAGDPRPTAG